MGRTTEPLSLEDVLDFHERLITAARKYELDFVEVGSLKEDGECFPVGSEQLTPMQQAFRDAWARVRPARARVLRRHLLSEDNPNRAHFQKAAPVFDDSLRDKAQKNLRDARAALNRALEAFQQHAEAVRQLHSGAKFKPTPEEYGARQCGVLKSELEQLIERTHVFQGSPEITTKTEWAELVTECAKRLLSAGLSGADLVVLVYGEETDSDQLEKNERALDERIRSRKSSP